MMTPCHSPLNQENFGTGFSNSYIDNIGDFGNVDFIQMTQKNNYVAPCSSGSQTVTNNISGIYLDSNLNYYQTDTKDMKSILEVVNELRLLFSTAEYLFFILCLQQI